MFYQNELDFLRRIFQKNHVSTRLVPLSEYASATADSNEAIGLERIPTIEEQTVYRQINSFGLCRHTLLLPDTDTPTVLEIGPFLSSPISQKRILEIGEQHGISPQSQRYLSEYYLSLPVLSDGSALLTMLDTLCERIWKGAPFRTLEVTHLAESPDTPISRSMRDLMANDTLVNIKALERRYAFENELIRAVKDGQSHAETRFQSAFSVEMLEKRTPDPLRNAKNYCIIMNTLLRKAAEQGGLHPFQIDQLSSEFANRIEVLQAVAECSELMQKMFRSYCRAVRKHAVRQYSAIVQKAILTIDANLSADLAPSTLSDSQGISLSYFSALFKKETGQTVCEYIRHRRLKYAAYLLETTELQIQTVALHCGIMDVQYFSKLFKKHYQKTPTEYREQIRQTSVAGNTV